MRIKMSRLTLAVTVTAVAAVLAGCGSSATPAAAASAAAGPGSSGAVIPVVASTNVWGDIVKQVGGEYVDVVSVIADPSADPHSYEANAQTQLALSKAKLVVENGGGYDDFMDTMLASNSTDAPVINAVEISGLQAAAGEELNEHVWYDFPTVDKVANQIAVELGTVDPANKAVFTANAATFSDKLAGLTTKVAAIKAQHAGVGIAITEPVPLYLTEAAGLQNLTPAEFSEAIENETDVPADVLAQTLALFTDKKIVALVYNEQTTGPQTEAVLEAAKTNSIAVVPVTETLPEAKDYLSWMDANITALSAALGT